MQNLNERGAAYIPIAEAMGITPHSDKCCSGFLGNDIGPTQETEKLSD